MFAVEKLTHCCIKVVHLTDNLCILPAALVVIFYPLIEAREIFYAIFGFGPLAKRRRERKAIKKASNGHANGVTELGKLHTDNLPGNDFKQPHESDTDAKIDILNGGPAAAAP